MEAKDRVVELRIRFRMERGGPDEELDELAEEFAELTKFTMVGVEDEVEFIDCTWNDVEGEEDKDGEDIDDVNVGDQRNQYEEQDLLE